MTERTYGYPGGPKNMGKKKKKEKGVGGGEPTNPFDSQNTNDAAGKPVKGTGKREGDLGVGWGP